MVIKNKKIHIRIGRKLIAEGMPCFIIAEAGSNHSGDLGMAKKLISAASKAGADAIKFQLFTAEELSNDRKTRQILEKYEFKREWLPVLKEYADSKGIIFLATPFDEAAVCLLESVGVEAYKIASGDLTYLNLVACIAKKKKPVLLSVGMATDNEIREAIEVIHSAGNKKIVLLHCVSDYPGSVKDINLLRIKALKNKFGLPVGFSDHTLGIHIAVASICFDAVVIEKHFTLNRNLQGPDHSFALEPSELKEMVEFIRDVEKASTAVQPHPLKCEKKGLSLGRRSLFARRDIAKGSVISKDDIKVVRPSSGISAQFYLSVIGKKARQAIKDGAALTWEKIN